VFLPSNGSPIVQGRDAIERSWAELFKNVGGDETITVKYAIPAGNDAVVAINEFKIVGDGENSNKIISGRASITLVKTPDGWRYVSIVPRPNRHLGKRTKTGSSANAMPPQDPAHRQRHR
jgi:ketosteroid isomerase-like protein